ncbi:MAG: Haloacid dehalogenase domain protein hydrolase [Akkermansiaceae bacterium]|nr:Haloacid dehalogenase domain protein hydrolase [Akkermansiaceae bacterium]
MIPIDIPGFGPLRLVHLVIDFNGTLAIDRCLHLGIGQTLRHLAERLEIHVVTGDESGDAMKQLGDLPLRLTLIQGGNQAEAKLDYVKSLGAESVVAIGNGRNDHLMIEAAALGIAVIHKEGAAQQVIRASDVVTTSVIDALDLLFQPRRLISTLRS